MFNWGKLNYKLILHMITKYILLFSLCLQLIDATKCYYNEARWREEGDAPATVEEHLLFSMPSSCCMHVPALAFVAIGATSDAIDWAMTYPKIIRASCVVGRVINDVASHEVAYLQPKHRCHGFFVSNLQLNISRSTAWIVC
jgi:hypothetical protein